MRVNHLCNKLNILLIVSIVFSLLSFFLLEFVLISSPHEYFATRLNIQKGSMTLSSNGEFLEQGAIEAFASLDYYLPKLPRFLVIDVDDCLTELNGNHLKLSKERLPYCNFRRPFIVEVPSISRDIGNQFKIPFNVNAKVKNLGGKGKIKIMLRPSTMIELILRVLLLVFGTLSLFLGAWKISKINPADKY